MKELKDKYLIGTIISFLDWPVMIVQGILYRNLPVALGENRTKVFDGVKVIYFNSVTGNFTDYLIYEDILKTIDDRAVKSRELKDVALKSWKENWNK